MRHAVRPALGAACAVLALLLPGCSQPGAPSSGGATRSTTSSATSAPTLSAPGLVDELDERVLIAHRGGKAEQPENSLVAFRAAARSGFPVETDLRTLRDGTVVPLHDRTVDRTTNGRGSPEDLTVAEWRRLRIDVGPGDTPVPTSTWDEVLAAVGGKAVLVVETKDRESVRPFIDSVLARRLQGSVLAQSFELADVEATARAGIPSMLLTSSRRDFSRLRAAGIAYIGCSGSESGLVEYVRAARTAGMHVAVWTIDDPAAARAAFSAGAFAVMTNAPWRLTRAGAAA